MFGTHPGTEEGVDGSNTRLANPPTAGCRSISIAGWIRRRQWQCNAAPTHVRPIENL
jgi:hypothetical protein